jgi:uncharacterized protein Smg (DUF494 family)
MKDSLFEMLLSLFEKTLSEIKENTIPLSDEESEEIIGLGTSEDIILDEEISTEVIQSPKEDSIRVFTYHEQMKFTKASYQFLMRMLVWDVIHPNTFEVIINQLIFSDSRIVTLEETKWTIQNVLSETLSQESLAFLDLVLYQKEEAYSIH